MEKILICLVIALYGVNAFSSDPNNRINNGADALISNFPYMVSIQRIAEINTTGRGHKCGGAMITLQHVLTAASCLFNPVDGNLVPINAQQYRVFGGAASLTADNDQTRVRQIQNVTIYPDYIHPPASLHNIGIITLVTPFLNTTVSPIPLPIASFYPEDFTLCQIAGWGAQNSTTTASYALQYTRKYIYNQALCTNLYSQLAVHPNIFSSMVCAASYDIVSSGCQGDEGSPLVCSGGFTGILVQTNGCTVSSFPEVYTRISNYTTWIRTVTGGSSTIRPELTFFAILAVITFKILNRA